MNKHPAVWLLLVCFLFSDFGQAIKVEGGLRAIQELLKNARFWHNFAYGEKVYFKKGGYKQALKDFKSVVDPKTVRNVNVGFGKQGRVGDKTIRLLEAKGLVQMPALSIADKNKPGLPEAIIKYRN